MARVSENSTAASLQFALNKTKAKMEDLSIKGSTLKRITRPSDDPVSNIEAMSIVSNIKNMDQYTKNSDYSLLVLKTTENSISQLTDLLNKAKEIAITQSSDFYDKNIRNNVSKEVKELRDQALAISNRRIGQKYIFSGRKTLTRPFDHSGKYHGDDKNIKIEVSRNFFIPVNLNGSEVFLGTSNNPQEAPLNPVKNKDTQKSDFPPLDPNINPKSRDLASVQDANKFKKRSNIFAQLESLQTALETNDADLIRGLLPKFDESVSRLITLRTQIGSVVSTIEQGKVSMEANSIDQKTRKSKLIDADIAELFSDITKQQQILKTTYRATQSVVSNTLLDFIK